MDKTDIDAKIVQAIILLERQFMLIERLIEVHGICLETMERAIKNKNASIENTLDVYNYVFALIDNLIRYKKIAWTIPRLNYRSPEYRLFEATLGNLTDIRDQLQHINRSIDNNYSGPLLGTIFWISDNVQYIVDLNEIGRKRSSPGIIFDSEKGIYLHRFVYTYNNQYHDIGGAINGLRKFNNYIRGTVELRANDGPLDLKQHFTAVLVEFRLRPREQPDSPPGGN